MADVKADLKAVENLGKEIRAAEIVALGRLGERGFQHLRAEVPKITTNLQQGIAPPDVDEEKLTVTLTVSARSARTGGGTATVFNNKGEAVKSVKLRPTVAYNYAEVVALGNKDAVLKPKKGKAFLIPVLSAPIGEGYLSVGGKFYIVRRTRKGRAANPYHERAAKKLEAEGENIVGAVFTEFFN